MRVSREKLLEVFASLDSDELMASHASGTLTDLAYEVAEEEMRRRGIEPPQRTAPASAEARDVTYDPLVAIASFLTPTEAFLLQGLLEAEGVHAVVADAQMVQMNEFLAPALGGVRVLVPHSALGQSTRDQSRRCARRLSIGRKHRWWRRTALTTRSSRRPTAVRPSALGLASSQRGSTRALGA